LYYSATSSDLKAAEDSALSATERLRLLNRRLPPVQRVRATKIGKVKKQVVSPVVIDVKQGGSSSSPVPEVAPTSSVPDQENLQEEEIPTVGSAQQAAPMPLHRNRRRGRRRQQHSRKGGDSSLFASPPASARVVSEDGNFKVIVNYGQFKPDSLGLLLNGKFGTEHKAYIGKGRGNWRRQEKGVVLIFSDEKAANSLAEKYDNFVANLAPQQSKGKSKIPHM